LCWNRYNKKCIWCCTCILFRSLGLWWMEWSQLSNRRTQKSEKVWYEQIISEDVISSIRFTTLTLSNRICAYLLLIEYCCFIVFYRNLWLAIVLALPSIMVLYVLTNISYFTVMNKATLLSSNAVAVVRTRIIIVFL
jgi:hypothetical protein